MDFRNICKNVLSKLISKCRVSMLILPSRLSQNQFENNKSCESSITTRYQYISVCIYHCLKGSFMNSLFIAYKNNEWCYFVVRISSPLIWFYCVCVVSFCFSFSFLFFCGVYYLLRYWGKFVSTYNRGAKLFFGS